MTDVIKVVKNPDAEPVDEHGDILYPFIDWKSTGTAGGLYSTLPKDALSKKSFLLLALYSTHTWKALDVLKIDATLLTNQTKYECPWTGNMHHWFFPLVILCADIDYWLSVAEPSFGAEFARDNDWHRDFIIDEDDKSLVLSKPAKTIVGHGYTPHTYPSDGSGQLQDAQVLLSNGDFLAGKVWVWFNK